MRLLDISTVDKIFYFRFRLTSRVEGMFSTYFQAK